MLTDASAGRADRVLPGQASMGIATQAASRMAAAALKAPGRASLLPADLPIRPSLGISD